MAEDRLRASPLARRLARERGIDLSGMTGSGPGGRIVEADVAGDTSPASDAGTEDSAGPRGGAVTPIASGAPSVRATIATEDGSTLSDLTVGRDSGETNPSADPARSSPVNATTCRHSFTLERSLDAATFRLFQREFARLAPQPAGPLLARAAALALQDTGLLDSGTCALLDAETLTADRAARLALCDLTDAGVALFAPPLVPPFDAVIGLAAPAGDRFTATLAADARALPPAAAARLLAALAGRLAQPAALFA